MTHATTYKIDGKDFPSLEEFYNIITRDLLFGASWGHNLDAFNDVLTWPTVDFPYRLVWLNSDKSRFDLGYPETVRQLKKRLDNCHPSNVGHIEKELKLAMKEKGPTVFDWLTDIIRSNEEWVTLELV